MSPTELAQVLEEVAELCRTAEGAKAINIKKLEEEQIRLIEVNNRTIALITENEQKAKSVESHALKAAEIINAKAVAESQEIIRNARVIANDLIGEANTQRKQAEMYVSEKQEQVASAAKALAELKNTHEKFLAEHEAFKRRVT